MAQASDRPGMPSQSTSAQITVCDQQQRSRSGDPAPGSAVSTASVDLSGFVHFVDTSGDGQVEILVDGVSQGLAPSPTRAAQSTTWNPGHRFVREKVSTLS